MHILYIYAVESCVLPSKHISVIPLFLQKVICKGDIGILKDNSERSKWLVTGPGGLDMEVPSICLLVPAPNPLSISIANKYETCMNKQICEYNYIL